MAQVGPNCSSAIVLHCCIYSLFIYSFLFLGSYFIPSLWSSDWHYPPFPSLLPGWLYITSHWWSGSGKRICISSHPCIYTYNAFSLQALSSGLSPSLSTTCLFLLPTGEQNSPAFPLQHQNSPLRGKRLVEMPFFLFTVGLAGCCQNGQVHETWECGAGPGWMLLWMQSHHHEEHWRWHLSPFLQSCFGSWNWQLSSQSDGCHRQEALQEVKD